MRRLVDIRADLERRDLLDLARDMAAKRGSTLDDMLGPSHEPAHCLARHAFWYALRSHSEAQWSYPRIGALFGMHHTTILSGVRAYARWLASRRENAGEGAEAVAAE